MEQLDTVRDVHSREVHLIFDEWLKAPNNCIGTHDETKVTMYLEYTENSRCSRRHALTVKGDHCTYKTSDRRFSGVVGEVHLQLDILIEGCEHITISLIDSARDVVLLSCARVEESRYRFNREGTNN